MSKFLQLANYKMEYIDSVFLKPYIDVTDFAHLAVFA